MSSMESVADVITDHRGALVLTGAGMSTESGIPDYRGPDGTRRVTPMSHQEFVATSAARQRYWARSFVGWGRFSRAEPNSGHRAVAELQRAGVVGPIITQNVDGLHQEAGARDVIDLHGRLADVVCLTCESRCDRDLVQALMADANPSFAARVADLDRGDTVPESLVRPDGDVVVPDAMVADFVTPRCLVCGGDSLKPDVVFFGGSVAKPLVTQCFSLTDEAPALLVLGTSLSVMSGFRFVKRAAARGVPIVIITKGPTRGDALATVRVNAPLGVSLAALAGAVRRFASDPA